MKAASLSLLLVRSLFTCKSVLYENIYWNIKRCAQLPLPLALPLWSIGSRILIKEQFISPAVFSSWFMHIKFYLNYTLHMERRKQHRLSGKKTANEIRRCAVNEERRRREREKKIDANEMKIALGIHSSRDLHTHHCYTLLHSIAFAFTKLFALLHTNTMQNWK